jgi:archaellum component FlaC
MEQRKPMPILVQELLQRVEKLETKVEMLERMSPQNLATSVDFQTFQQKVFERLDIPTEPTIIENVQ